MNVYSVSLKGKRDQNEDNHNVTINIDNKDKTKQNINLFLLCDGHGGKFVSKFLVDTIPALLLSKKVQYPISKKYLLDMCNGTQHVLKTQFSNDATYCGSTCLGVIHTQNSANNYQYLNIFNSGDSRCVLCRDNIAIPLTKDHKPDWPDEVRRIKSLGGKIYLDGRDWRIRDLSVSRAFGDIDAEPYVTHVPDIFKYKIESSDKFMVLACDGLWDVMSNQDVVNYVLNSCYDKNYNRFNKNVNIARKLAEYSIAKGSMDNVSVLVVFF